ncbi:MAG: hypothetical protein ABID38_01810 [Candidatus Diapherotrites archaeon]
MKMFCPQCGRKEMEPDYAGKGMQFTCAKCGYTGPAMQGDV